MRLSAFLIATLFLGLGLSAAAHAQSLTIQGRVATSTNAPITGNAVQFRVQIRSPGTNNCVLFDETHVLDLSTTNGLFSVSLNDGAGTVNNPTTYGLEAAISNRTAFSVNSSYCASGTGVVTYTPLADDNRRVVIQFYDPSSMSGFEQIPEMDLNPMAFAMESRTVGGYPATSLLRVDTAGAPGAGAVFTAGQASELVLLANGTSTKYTPASATNGAQIPTYSSDPASPPAGSIWYNSTSGELHYRTSGGTQVVGAGGGGGGTITSVTVSGGLSGGGSSGTVNVGLPLGTSGQVLRHNGSNWGGYSYGLPDLLSTSLGSAVASSACTAGQTMYYDSTAKELKCQSIGLTSADLSGMLPVSHGGTGLSAGTVGAIPYFSSTSALSLLAAGSNGDVLTMNGSGVPVWQSLPASSFTGTGTTNRLAKFTGASAVGNSILTDDGTNVGIGTTAPIAKLEVAGSLRLADGGETCSAGANVGMMKYSSGSLFFCNASGWQTLGVSGAGLTSLNGLTTNTQTFAIGSAGTSPAWSSAGSVHTLNLPTASASNSGLLSSADWSTFNGKLGTSTSFVGDVTGTYNANVVTKLQGVAVGTTAPAAGQSLKLVGSTWTPANLGFGDLKTTGGAATMATAVCNAGQTMYYDTTTGDLKCQAIALDNASVTGTVAVANGGTGVTSTSQNYVFAGPTSGSGAPSFRALTAGDLPASASYWQAATGGINYAGGSVGIGTSAPLGALDLGAGSPVITMSTNSAIMGNLYFNSGWKYRANGTGSYMKFNPNGTNGGGVEFGVTPAVNASGSGTTATVLSALNINDSGNVGIGTYGATALVDIFSNNTNSASNTGLLVRSGYPGYSGTTVSILALRDKDNSVDTFNVKTDGSLALNRFTAAGVYQNSLTIDLNGKVGLGTTAPASTLDLSGKTDALALPKGSTAQQPSSVPAGSLRYNTNNLALEFYNGSSWVTLSAGGSGTYYSASGGTISGNVTITPSSGTGLTVTSGGASIAGGLTSSGVLNVSNTTASTSTTTGAATVSGGLGVAGTVNANILAAAAGAANAPSHTFTSDLTSGLWLPAASTLAWSTGGAEKMRLNSSGNLGIGSSSPVVALDVVGDGHFARAGGSQVYVQTPSTDGRIFALNSSGSAQQLLLNPSGGNVGVGTSSPGSTFQVLGGLTTGSGTWGTTSGFGVTIAPDLVNGINYIDNHTQNVGANGAALIFRGGHGSSETAFQRPIFTLKTDSGYVGIGSTSPKFPLVLTKDAASAVSSVMFGDWQNNGQFVIQGESNPQKRLAMGVDTQAGTMAGVIQAIEATVAGRSLLLNPSGGNVGVGTTAPTARMMVMEPSLRQFTVGPSSSTWADVSSGGGGVALFGSNAYMNGSDNTFRYSITHNISGGIRARGLAINYPAWGDQSFFTSNGATTQDASFTPTTLMTMKSTGSVGIGVTAPSSRLHVHGDDWNGLTLTDASNADAIGTLKYDPVGAYVSGKSFLILSDETANTHTRNGGIMFRTNNGASGASTLPAMTIRENGSVGIGTISPGSILHLASAAPYITFEETDTTQKFFYGVDGSQMWWRQGTIGTVNLMTFSNVGNMAIAGTLSQSSDARLKTEIREINDSLEKLTRIRGVTYRWSDPHRDQGEQIGVIAQEVEKEFPQAVKTDKEGFKSVAYQNLVGPILNALRELRDRLLAVEGETHTLAADNQALKREVDVKSREIAALKADAAAKDRVLQDLLKRVENLERAGKSARTPAKQ